MVKPITLKEISRSIAIGVLKGVLYYVIISIVIVWFIINYVVPLIIRDLAPEITLPSIIEYEYINYFVLTLFIVFSVISTILTRHVPYGSVASNMMAIGYTYVLLTNIGNAEYKYVYSKYGELKVNITPLLNTLLYLVIILSIANTLLALAREYRKRRK